MADDVDIAIIGGGINGAGIARDAALRGLRVLLLERSDFGSGTSSWSSRLIHGGLRYLEYGEIPLVYESLRERRLLRALAPHLVERLLISIPVYRGARRGPFVIRLGMLAYDLLSLGKKLPRHRMLSCEAMLAAEPGLRRAGLRAAAQYYDHQVTYAERLVMENVVGAREAGAEVRNYCPVIGINVKRGRVESLHYVDRRSGDEREIGARVIINASGPWVDRVLATVNRELPQCMGGTKGSHIVVGRFHGAPRSAFYVEAQSDRRPIFIIPWNGQYLVGTTDTRYEGDPAQVLADANEVAYLLDETNRVFPAAHLTIADVHYAYAGIRPLPRRDKGPEAAITRKHIIRKHGREARGLISIIGGKLTTYRNLAEQAVDAAVGYIAKRCDPCRTRSLPLPGAIGIESVSRDLRERLSDACTDRLLSIYGSRAKAILDLHEKEPGRDYLDAGQTLLAAEVVHALRNEFAIDLTDIVHRRTMAGLGEDQGAGVAAAMARAAACEAGWDEHEASAQLEGLENYNRRFQAFRAGQ